MKPETIVVTGSRKHCKQIDEERMKLALLGKIALGYTFDLEKRPDLFSQKAPCPSCRGRQGLVVICDKCGHTGEVATRDNTLFEDVKKNLDANIYHMIDLADALLVVNVNGYVGEEVTRQIQHALKSGIPVLFTDPKAIPAWVGLMQDEVAKQTPNKPADALGEPGRDRGTPVGQTVDPVPSVSTGKPVLLSPKSK